MISIYSFPPNIFYSSYCANSLSPVLLPSPPVQTLKRSAHGAWGIIALKEVRTAHTCCTGSQKGTCQTISDTSGIRAPAEAWQHENNGSHKEGHPAERKAGLIHTHDYIANWPLLSGERSRAAEDGSAKVPLHEQQQSNRLMGYTIAEKLKGK